MLKSVSATQIKQFRSCALQWYLQRVEGWEYPQSASQELGEQVHGQIEKYLLKGATADLLPSVENAIKKGLVPAYGVEDRRVVEEPADYAMEMTCADVPVKGRIDLLLPPGDEGLVRVVDWKTAKSFNYTPTPDALTRDVQGVLYLRYAFAQYPYATEGQFRHVYLLTKGTGSKKVDAEVVTPEFIDGQWRHLEQTVEDMKATGTRPLPVVTSSQANLSHCDQYGGCAFRDRCPAASKGLVSLMAELEAQDSQPANEEGTMSALAEKLKARAAAKVAEAPAPAVVVAPVVEPAPVAVATVLPPDAPGGDLVPESAEPPTFAEKLRRRAPVKKAATVAVAQADPEKAAAIREELTARGAVGVEQAIVDGDPPVVVAPVVVDEPPVVVAPAEVVEPPVVVVEAPTPLSLYIDCYPEKAAFETLRALEDEVAARTPSILEHLRKTSPKDVPEGAVDLGEVLFGRGYSTLAASFVLKPITGPWTVSTLGPASSKLLEVLLPKATFVVRGRR